MARHDAIIFSQKSVSGFYLEHTLLSQNSISTHVNYTG